MNYMTLYNHPISTITTAASDLVSADRTFYWGVTDDGPQGSVHFLTETRIYGNTIADLPKSALYRMLCFYLIGKLDGAALEEACESLADIYSWQADSRNAMPPPEPDVHFIPSSHLTEIQRSPFVIE
jgi:hypothetical protein